MGLPLRAQAVSLRGLPACRERLEQVATTEVLNMPKNINKSKNLIGEFREALKRINTARKTAAVELSLFRLGLTEVPPQVFELIELQSLDLTLNKLTVLPVAVSELRHLQSLSLSNNKLTTLPATVSELRQLQSLSLSNNKLTALPVAVSELRQLQSLFLSGNQLTALPESVSELKQLQSLYLSDNRLTALPEMLGKWTQLLSLDLSGNDLTALPESLSKLSQLQSLNIRNNQLTAVPVSLSQLRQLQSLDLSGNQLTALPQSLSELRHLHSLNLSDNELTSLPESLTNLTSLEELYLHGNGALGLPAEILGPTKLESNAKNRPAKPAEILDYYFRVRSGGRRPLNEAKLILVGRGAAGKTSIVNRLVEDTFKPERKTEGIKITEWRLLLNGDEDIRLNVWDFGGQEIMHATHQFFLTQRSLYLIVLNGREGGEDADAEYWLKLIESFGGDSPVIVVLNKIKEHPFDVNRRALELKYPIRDFIRTDCQDGTGIDELRNAIKRETDRLEDLRKSFPAGWFTIKNQLAGMKENYLSFPEYRRICEQNGETDSKAQESLAGFLHRLGIALNYRDDTRLKDTHVLNPQWVTNGIYKILNSEKLQKQKGELCLKDLSEILDASDYPAAMHHFLLDLMKKFELCFSFPEDDNRYLIPELLDKQEPLSTDQFRPEECLNFQYHYIVLPEGLLPRFIVRTHVLSEEQPRWRTGVILDFEGCRALVRADAQDRKVFISVAGRISSRRRLLAVIRSEFERIHRDIRNLQPDEMVPVPGYAGLVVSYRKLVVMEQKGVIRLSEVIGDQVVELNVPELLNGVDIDGTRRRDRTPADRQASVQLFYVYSHKDEVLRNELETHLKLMQRQGLIDGWHDRKIEASEDWKEKIDENLERAGIILLLISPDFIASDYCYELEMKRALERHEQGTARVIPVIVRDVNWTKLPFSKLQALPKDGLPVTRWTNRDSAWRNFSEGLDQIIQGKRRVVNDSEEEAIFISGISLKNIRCFRDVEISFLSDDGLARFILLFGDNGVGKTTLLRSIALGLCDVTTATALIETLAGFLLRVGAKRGSIRSELSNSSGTKRWVAETVLRRKQKGEVVVEQQVSNDFPFARVFACGYGAARRGFGSQDYSGYSLGNSLDPLFNYDLTLQNPELAFRRIEAKQGNINEVLQRIDAVLMLEPGSTWMDSTGIRIRGPWGDFMPLGGLGDGYQATLGWIADLFGWALLYSPALSLAEISGIVLIDEIEQHLHPSWQREIIQLLHRQFPKIQFITTSHSPMCALGATGLPASVAALVRLRQSEDHAEAMQFAIPTGQRADQVLTSPLFGLFSASAFDVSADIQRYAELASKSRRSDSDKAEFIELGGRLEAALTPFETELERRIDEAVQEAMDKELGNALKSGKVSSKAVRFQIRNRLGKYFRGGERRD